MNGTDSIVIHGLKKSYRKDLPPAVDLQGEVRIRKGELFGIIGPDGAGKTTLFRLLATLVLPDGGSATLEGLDIVRDYRKIRTLLGYMPGKFSLYSDLSVRENLLNSLLPPSDRTLRATMRSSKTSTGDSSRSRSARPASFREE